MSSFFFFAELTSSRDEGSFDGTLSSKSDDKMITAGGLLDTEYEHIGELEAMMKMKNNVIKHRMEKKQNTKS